MEKEKKFQLSLIFQDPMLYLDPAGFSRVLHVQNHEFLKLALLVLRSMKIWAASHTCLLPIQAGATILALGITCLLSVKCLNSLEDYEFCTIFRASQILN